MFSVLVPFYQLIAKRIFYNTFDMTDGIELKIDKLTVMMGKLVTEGWNKQFKLQVNQSNRGRGQTR